MQAKLVGSADPSPAVAAWVLPLLVLSAMLQALVTSASLCALVLFFAASQVGALRDALGVATALVEAFLRLGLHVLFFA